MTRLPIHILLLAALSVAPGAAWAQPAPAPGRGQLLYNTDCVECHSTQMHWREQRQARDWDSLKVQVRRWQGNAGLCGNDDDVVEVARHLNETLYHHPQASDRVGMAR